MRKVFKMFLSAFVLTNSAAKRFKSPHIFQTIHKSTIHTVSDNQLLYLSYLNSNSTKLIFGLGYAGTGKTYIACQYAMQQLMDQQCQRVIITKPFITVSEESIGFLPGSIASKMQPWMANMLQCMNSGVGSKSITRRFVDSNQLEFAPMGFMRGSTIEDTIVIADEMQNSSPSQMKMLLTRIGKNAKIIITGDIHQKDICHKSGIEDFLEKLPDRNTKNIKIVQFGLEDVARDDFVKEILQIYENLNHGKEIKNNHVDTLQLYSNLISDSPKRNYYFTNGNKDNGNNDDSNNDAAMIPKRLK